MGHLCKKLLGLAGWMSRNLVLGGGRLFKAECLLTFSTFRVGAYNVFEVGAYSRLGA